MRSPSELTEQFRAQGLKVTPQRQCIFRVLRASEGHPTAEMVYDQARVEMPTLSLRTVYQTLHDLAEMGELHELNLGTGSVRFDTNVGSHQHLVCRVCGKVLDLDANVTDPSLPPEAAHGFQIDGVEVTYRGTCPTCASAA